MNIRNKHIAIIGAKRSGIAAAKLALLNGAIPFVSESKNESHFSEEVKFLNEKNITYEFGGHTEKVFNSDLMVVSPGVPSDAPIIKEALNKNIEVISEIEFASWFNKAKIIGVTGSNGKTTTTSLIAHILEVSGYKKYSAGNIGTAFSSVVTEAGSNDIIALELSSFQLDFIKTFKPNSAIILNITPDHLDRYEYKFENYIASKYRIAKNQTEEDILVLNADNEFTHNSLINSKANIVYTSTQKELEDGIYFNSGEVIYKKDGEIIFKCKRDEIFLRGDHNLSNAMAAIAALKYFNISNENIIKGLKSFKGVEHRLEYVETINGIGFINDSKATNVDSVKYALNSFSNPIYLILGGLDKGNDYNQIKDLVIEKVKKIYAIGSSKEKIFNFFSSLIPVEYKNDLHDCINSALDEAISGDIVLLSPACASFDMFDNYEHRGKIFKDAVKGKTR